MISYDSPLQAIKSADKKLDDTKEMDFSHYQPLGSQVRCHMGANLLNKKTYDRTPTVDKSEMKNVEKYFMKILFNWTLFAGPRNEGIKKAVQSEWEKATIAVKEQKSRLEALNLEEDCKVLNQSGLQFHLWRFFIFQTKLSFRDSNF